jgi:hypothetical protein
MEELISILRKSDLSLEQIDKILLICKIKTIDKNEILVENGTVCDKAFLVLKGGFVNQFVDNENDTVVSISFHLEDFQSMFTCNDSYFTGKATNCQIKAMCDSSVVEILKSDLEELYKVDLGIFQYNYEIISKMLMIENELKIKVLTESSEDLYGYLMLNCGSLIKIAPSKYIAEFMGISPEWLSKLKRKN